MKLISALLALVLFATACGSSGSDVPAVAASNAQAAEQAQQADDEEDAQDAQAAVAAASDQPPFCQAVDALVDYPFVDFPFADAAIAHQAATSADGEVLELSHASYRAVAEVVPADAPNIIKSYFATVPDAVDDALRPTETSSLNPDYLANLIVAGSIRVNEVADYVAAECPEARLAKQPFTPLFTVTPDAFVTPMQAEFCDGLTQLEDVMLALQQSGGDDTTEIPLTEQLQTTTFAVTGLLDADVNRSTTAFLRVLSRLAESAFTDDAAAGAALQWLANLDGAVVANGLRSSCPNVSDPARWLIEPLTVPTSEVRTSSSLTITDSVSSGDGSFTSQVQTASGQIVRTERTLVTAVDGTIVVGSVSITVGDVFFERSHVEGTARDTDETFLEVWFSFDRGHELTAADFSLTDPDGAVFEADPDRTVALDQGFVRFPVDRDAETTVGWTLQAGDATVAL